MSETDYLVDKLIYQYDETSMPLPDMESEPHHLISKVRKHYMEYIIKLLSVNYENNQKLPNKNIYLPSAIWRCAKSIEMNAAQRCMMVQLYRKNITTVINDLKNDTNKGKLNKKLYECLHRAPENEKKTQTTMSNFDDCNCLCNCNTSKKRRKASKCLQEFEIDEIHITSTTSQVNGYHSNNKIPVVVNLNTEYSQAVQTKQEIPPKKPPLMTQPIPNNDKNQSNVPLQSSLRISTESQDSDELTMQLEKLFQCDANDDDLFDVAFCDSTLDLNDNRKPDSLVQKQDMAIETHAAQIKSLDERITSLAGMLEATNAETTVPQQKPESSKSKKSGASKWLCEEYFLKTRFHQLLDEIGDGNRKKLARIKESLLDLFGDDIDEKEAVSPLEETQDFIISCKERIAPWVVKLLTPYYFKGRIKGKALFKSLAKHLIRLIYQCSRYPEEYEVHSFVSDFLVNHKMITCEADYQQFRIENIG